MKRRIFVILTCLISAGFGLLFIKLWHQTIQPRSAPPRKVLFDKVNIDLTSRFQVQGEPIVCDVNLKNDEDHDIYVDDLPRSCGCTLLNAEQEIRFPIRIGAFSSLPLKLNIPTEHRGGFQHFEMGALYRNANGERFEVRPLAVSARIRTRVIAAPGEAVLELASFDGTANRRRVEIKLADNWEGTGLPIKSITCQNQGRVRIKDVPATGAMSIAGTELKHRRTLWISPAEGAESAAPFEETITIQPEDKRVGSTAVIIHGVRALRHDLSPKSLLVVCSDSSQPTVRYVEFRCRETTGHQFDIVAKPPGVNAVLESVTPHRAIIKLTIDSLQAREALREGVLVLGVRGTTEKVELPVKVIRGG